MVYVLKGRLRRDMLLGNTVLRVVLGWQLLWRRRDVFFLVVVSQSALAHEIARASVLVNLTVALLIANRLVIRAGKVRARSDQTYISVSV